MRRDLAYLYTFGTVLKDDTRGFLSEQLDSVMLPPLNVSRLDWLAGRVSFRDCVHGAQQRIGAYGSTTKGKKQGVGVPRVETQTRIGNVIF